MKATPEQWANMADAASDGFDDGYGACILELRARVEVLEARRPASKVYEINEPLKLTPEQQEEIAALLRPNSKPTPNPSQIRSSLVERVESALMASVKDQGSMARAAIREVAEWLREEGYPSSPSRLEREVEQ